eukprot:11156762-Lingulodinium_polyedra.AAC.1
MYGTRDASHIWQEDYSEHLLDEGGYKRGVSNPAVFVSEDPDESRMLVHGDGFAALSDDEGLAKLEAVLGKRYDFKRTGRLGGGPEDDEECVFLNRVLRFTGTEEEPS